MSRSSQTDAAIEELRARVRAMASALRAALPPEQADALIDPTWFAFGGVTGSIRVEREDARPVSEQWLRPCDVVVETRANREVHEGGEEIAAE